MDVRDLLSILFAVAPEVARGPNLVNRALPLTGVTLHTSPEDLLDLFPLETEAAAVVRDYETGERAGLVVLANEGDCEVAIAASVPSFSGRETFYRECIRARDGQESWVLAQAARDHARRRATTDLLRHLLPPVYIEEDSSIHLRCVFLRVALGVSSRRKDEDEAEERKDEDEAEERKDEDEAEERKDEDEAEAEELPEKGGVCAVIVCKAQSIGVLVYDDADSAESVARSLVGSRSRRFRTYDSPMFPFAAALVRDAAGAAEAPPGDLELLGTIPRFYTHPAYLERTILFRGLDTETCDAWDVARCIKSDLDLEAVIVHRSKQLVVVVFSSKEDALLQLHETADTWISLFGVPLTCGVVHAAQLFGAQDKLFGAQDNEEELVAPAGGPYPGVHCKAIQQVHNMMIAVERKKTAPNHAAGIARVLLMSTALSRPDAVRHRCFPDRAVLLLGIHPATNSWDHLRAVLSAYGGLDALTVDSPTCAALAVFKRWDGAFKLLGEPIQSCWSMGFRNCQRVPGAEHVSETVDEVRAELFRLDAQLKKCQVPEVV